VQVSSFREEEQNLWQEQQLSPVLRGGIGAAVAERLAKDGFAVVVNYAGKAAPAQSFSGGYQGCGGQGIAVQADVAIVQTVGAALQRVDGSFGKPDVVIHCRHIRCFPSSDDVPPSTK